MENMGWLVAAIGVMGAFFSWFVRSTIKNELSDFRQSLTKEFGERFLDTNLATARMEPMQRDILALRDRLNQVEEYTHKRYHDLSGDIQKCFLSIEKRDSK